MQAEEGASLGVRVDAFDNGDEFMLSVPGASGSLVRTGRGSTSRVAVREVSSAYVAMLELGFPTFGAAHAVDEHLIICHMLDAPGGRWDRTELAAGQSFVYPPGSTQVATNPKGLRFGMVVAPWVELEEAADALGYDLSPAAEQHVRADGAGSHLTRLFDDVGLGATLGDDHLPPGWALDVVVEAAVRTACRPDEPASTKRRRRWESDDLVADVIEWLTASDLWQVPMVTLCRNIGASERRLQSAFREALDTTPGHFLRLRALQSAHEALASGQPGAARVGEVAAAHGFTHRGRFAALYTSVYGGAPSATLRRTSRRER